MALPREPDLHPVRYYKRSSATRGAQTFGELEEALRAAIAEAVAFTSFL